MWLMYIAPVIRHLASMLGTWLVAKGLVDSNGADQIVGGLMATAALVWSLYSKRKANPPQPS